MLGVLLRFRQDFTGMVGDIKKMYNCVQISPLDQNCHRFLWREMRTENQPDQYALTTVTFGDSPGGAIAMIALRKTAQMSNGYPRATRLIENDSYVDYLITSVEDYAAARELMQEVDTVLDKGGFHIKEWVISGEGNFSTLHPKVVFSREAKVLGISWHPHHAHFYFKICLNFSKKMTQIFERMRLRKGYQQNLQGD